MIIAILILSAAVFLFVFAPALSSQGRGGSLGPRQNEDPLWPKYQRIAQERDMILNNLKDLEVDQQMEKLNPSDYIRMRNDLYEQIEMKSSELATLEETHPIFTQIRADLQEIRE